jgi:hypothetical protein
MNPAAPDMEILSIVNRMTWIWAKSFARFAPHWYTRRFDCNEDDYSRLYHAIKSKGVDEQFGRKTYRYIYPGDGYKYWVMTDDFSQSIITNRAVAVKPPTPTQLKLL